MGLHDEYIESISQDNRTNVKDNTIWNPPLPNFDQYYPGMPYSADTISMMKANRAPRLRHLWYFCRWLNETNEVTALTNSTTFKVYQSERDYSYTLDQNYQNFYESVFSEENVINNTFGKYDLFLYKIGDDETTDRLITTQSDFDSILVVRTKIQWLFEDNTPGRWMDISSKLLQMRNFQTAVGNQVNGKYYLQRSDSGSDFDKIYVYFNPHYHFERGASGQHFTVNVNTVGTETIEANFFEDGFTDDELEFDENLDPICIYRYMLGLVPYRVIAETKVERSTITLDDLSFLETWVEDAGRCGGSYSISQG